MRKTICIILVLLLAAGIFYLHRSHDWTVQEILAWQPPNLMVAALVILAAYAVKSVLIFVPIMVMQIASGHFFSKEAAIFINTLGLAIVMAVPYWMGRLGGSKQMEKIMRRYPKVAKLVNLQHDNEMAVCFMLRACAVPPPDVVTMYLGASNVHFLTNVVGGVMGSFPCMVLTTLLGANIRDPASPAFWQVIALNIVWVLLSALGCWLFKRFSPSMGKEET